MHLIAPSFGPLDINKAHQVLSDSNGDFAVIGICSANAASSSIVAALGSLLSGQQQQAATAAAAAPGSLQGLRMHVHPRDRLIVLDASHILSPDVLAALLAPERPKPAVGAAAAAAVRAAASRAGSNGAIPVEGVAALLGLQLLSFLLAVCNVVVVGASEFDLHLLQQLEACCHISSSIPDLTLQPAQQQQQQQAGVRGRSSPAMHAASKEATHDASTTSARHGRGQPRQQHVGAGSSSSIDARRQRQQQLQAELPHHVADLVLLHCCGSQQLTPTLQQQQQLLDAALAGTVWSRRTRQLSTMAMRSATDSQQQHNMHNGMQHFGNSSAGINIWLVPPPKGSNSSSKVLASNAISAAEQQLPPQLPPHLLQLTSKLLAWPRSSSSSSSGCFSRPLSEREWLKAAERVWEAVQGSRELLQYYQAAAEARYIAAGGWRQR